MLDTDHPLNYGRPGVYGTRAANLVIQNSDLVISIGNRMSILMIGYEQSEFAREAKIVQIDIDQTELEKTKNDFIGSYDTISCAELYGQHFQSITTDHMIELNQRDKERIFNLGYYTWVEQQGVDLNHFESRRHQSFWDMHLQKMLDLDEEIDKFNNL